MTCKSDGYPAPSYTWTDSNGAVLSTTSVARILTPGPFNWTCTAAGNFTTPCSASHSVIGNASGKKQTSRLVVKYLYSYFFYRTSALVSEVIAMILSVRLSVALWYNFNKGRPTVYIGSCSTSKTLVLAM